MHDNSQHLPQIKECSNNNSNLYNNHHQPPNTPLLIPSQNLMVGNGTCYMTIDANVAIPSQS